MADILVTWYSRSGSTEKAARALAERLGADARPLLTSASYAGPGGFLRGIWDSLRRRTPDVTLDADPAAYRLVVVGAPIWAGKPAAPLRSFLSRHGPRGEGGRRLLPVRQRRGLAGRLRGDREPRRRTPGGRSQPVAAAGRGRGLRSRASGLRPHPGRSPGHRGLTAPLDAPEPAGVDGRPCPTSRRSIPTSPPARAFASPRSA